MENTSSSTSPIVSGLPSLQNTSFEDLRKRFHTSVSPHVPTLVLDREASIVHLTPKARQLLEYKPDDDIEPYFFSHVHGRNLHQVMRDLRAMFNYGKSRAAWLIQMRTGQERWRWYKARVENMLHVGEGVILVTLNDLYNW